MKWYIGFITDILIDLLLSAFSKPMVVLLMMLVEPIRFTL